MADGSARIFRWTSIRSALMGFTIDVLDFGLPSQWNCQFDLNQRCVRRSAGSRQSPANEYVVPLRTGPASRTITFTDVLVVVIGEFYGFERPRRSARCASSRW